MEQEIIRNLEQFVSFRTIAGANEEKRRCLEWLEETFLKSYKLKAISYCRGDVAGCPYLLLTHPSPKLLFFAHIDVVPGGEEQFSLKRVGDKLYGRGTKDMKGATLPFLLAYKEACVRGGIPPVSVLLTSDEETAGPTIPTLLNADGTKNQKRITSTLRSVPCAFTPDTGANPHIVTETKGVVWATLVAEGRGAHAALPWEGENPIPVLARAIQHLTTTFPSGNDRDWRMTVTVTQLQGSDARNKVPDEAHCSLDIRYPPSFAPRRMPTIAPRCWKSFFSQRYGAPDGEPQGAKVGSHCVTPEEILALVRCHLPEGCRLELFLSTPPLTTDPKHPLVQLMKKIGEEVTGKEVPIGREHGASDARYFSSAGIPAFLYGPIGGGIHGGEEWVSLSSLLQHCAINRRLLEALR